MRARDASLAAYAFQGDTLFLQAILGRSGGALYESKGSLRFSCGPFLAEVVVHYMRARGSVFSSCGPYLTEVVVHYGA